MSLRTWYPLRFAPLFRQYVWGGRRLATRLGKLLPDSRHDYAESWEVVDHEADQSRVLAGKFQGQTLGELFRTCPHELLGPFCDQSLRRFPLLFKFLDCARDLSVQVHPNDQQAAQLEPPDLGKTEAWVVIDAEPGSVMYAGLQAGIDRTVFAEAIEQGRVEQATVEQCLHRIEPRPGDCILIPAGTVHALGAGLLIAEIQQASDTTYRLFDWNRAGPDGRGGDGQRAAEPDGLSRLGIFRHR